MLCKQTCGTGIWVCRRQGRAWLGLPLIALHQTTLLKAVKCACACDMMSGTACGYSQLLVGLLDLLTRTTAPQQDNTNRVGIQHVHEQAGGSIKVSSTIMIHDAVQKASVLIKLTNAFRASAEECVTHRFDGWTARIPTDAVDVTNCLHVVTAPSFVSHLPQSQDSQRRHASNGGGSPAILRCVTQSHFMVE